MTTWFSFVNEITNDKESPLTEKLSQMAKCFNVMVKLRKVANKQEKQLQSFLVKIEEKMVEKVNSIQINKKSYADIVRDSTTIKPHKARNNSNK